ncbi:alpha/beta hydrolase [Aureitalea marina]|uniref:Esterase n=1 Tax=Aureitalea marina TaxID=930804 RepID=A0A2S7KN77_9FLAO|nr:alpha/beta hydrolase-fold protein [Aureitalea marina]PQB04062.1 hypothetical protein BST85_03460 [Aureitalea marina]
MIFLSRTIAILLFTTLFLGCQDTAFESGQVSVHQINSELLQRSVEYSLYTPTNSTQSLPEQIIYLLHGHGGDHRDWFQDEEGAVAAILDSLIDNNIIPPVLAVSANMGNSWYVNRPAPAQDFYLQEFIQHIESTYLQSEPKQRLLAGNSAGGYGGLRFSLIRPELFENTILLSPASYTPLPPDISSSRKVEAFAVNGKFNDSIWDSFSYLHLLKRLKPGDQLPGFYISTGDDDVYNIVPAVTRIQQEFLSLGITNELRITNGGHDWDCWKSNFAEALSLIYQQ